MTPFFINDGLNHTNATMSQQRILHEQTECPKMYFFLCMADNSLINQNHKPLLVVRI